MMAEFNLAEIAPEAMASLDLFDVASGTSALSADAMLTALTDTPAILAPSQATDLLAIATAPSTGTPSSNVDAINSTQTAVAAKIGGGFCREHFMADGDTGYLREAAFWKQSVLTLLLVTLALNVLSLTIPVAASQIFGHLIPAPYSPTLLILVASVVCLGAAEGLLRFARAAVLNRAGANFAGLITHRLLTHIITSDPPGGRLLASRSIEYLGAIQQLKEKYNGQIVVSMIELLFLPIILAAIFAISWMTGLFVLLCLAIFGLVTLLDARRMERLVDQSAAEGESRYDFLFTMLDAMHLIKALGIEDNILRRSEAGQSSMSRRNHQLGLVTGRLLNSASVASQSLTAATLALGAIAVGHGQTTMGESRRWSCSAAASWRRCSRPSSSSCR
ncbi:ABC transporter transmembrane domain-containing protein [Teichococcus aestuarii]|uniref:ABC transporter transmembrane domain-containing protein n=1 Tax=Teichococcus aestuarii TaxID=568898 RepID=UPI00361CF106